MVVSFKVKPLGGASGAERTVLCSAFVVETAGIWLLVTAGHVVDEMRERQVAGDRLSNFELHDRHAGNSFRLSVLFPFDPEHCVVINEADADFAAWPLAANTVRQLKAGGIAPIERRAWGPHGPEVHDVLLLVGVPAETHQNVGAHRLVGLTLIPLEISEPPVGVDIHPNTYCARLVQNPEADGASVRDLAGMSGSPIYGIKQIEGRNRYFIVGIHSGWFAESRVITFYDAPPFFEYLRQVIVDIADGKGAS